MISHKKVNLLIVAFAIVGLLFTLIFTYYPQKLGIVAAGQTPEYAEKLFDKAKIQSIDIAMSEEDWQAMLDNALAEDYVACDLTINGETFRSVGIRPKGNSSLSMVASDPTTERFSFKIKMDEYVDGQTYHGLNKFVINNMQGDATYMKEYLSYDLFDFLDVPTPLCAFTDVTLNGKAWGFYLAIECLEEDYAERNFGADFGELYKPETNDMGGGKGKEGHEQKEEGLEGRPQGMEPSQGLKQGQGMPSDMGNFSDRNITSQAIITQEAIVPPQLANESTTVSGGMIADFPGNAKGGEPGQDKLGGAGEPRQGGSGSGPGGFNSGGGADLKYVDNDTDNYNQIFEGSIFKTDQSDWQRVVTALKHLNHGEEIEKYVDVDEVLRYFAVNTVLVNLDSYVSNLKHNYYLYEKDGQIAILPWDLNLSFAGFMTNDAASAVNFPIDTPLSNGIALEDRPLIGKLLENEEYKEKYYEYLNKIVEEYFNSGYFENAIQQLDSLIGDHVQNDPSAFYTYDEYKKGVETLIQFGQLRALSIAGQMNGTIASTHETQKEEGANLVDAAGISINDMGTQGGGPGNGGPGGQRMPNPR